MATRYLLIPVLLFLTFGAAGGASQLRPRASLPSLPAATAELFDNHDYQAEGLSVGGELVAFEPFPSMAEFPPRELEEGEGVVFLRRYLWFPNPFSSPGVVVVVTQPSSFRLEVLDVGNEVIERFEFGDVATGVYFFHLEEPLPPVRPCLVRLVLDGEVADVVESRTDRGSYAW